MLTIKDIDEAIAEIEGARSVSKSDCIHLAAYYAIRDKLSSDGNTGGREYAGYSYADAPTTNNEEGKISLDSSSEFANAVNGKNAVKVWQVVDELMDTLKVINPRLYQSVLRKINI